MKKIDYEITVDASNLIPFNLEAALAGEPVVTRDRLEDVTQLTTFETSRGVILVGVMAGNVQTWTKNGEFHESGKISDYDLFMKPKTRVINGFDVPAPESEPLDEGGKYYVVDVNSRLFCEKYTWSGSTVDTLWLKRGLVFLAKKDAIANAKAMVGINPYESDAPEQKGDPLSAQRLHWALTRMGGSEK